jgi:hypothetical protein
MFDAHGALQERPANNTGQATNMHYNEKNLDRCLQDSGMSIRDRRFKGR